MVAVAVETMNLCGDDNHDFDMESSVTDTAASTAEAKNFQCGGCVEVDEEEFFAAARRLSAIAVESSDEEEEELKKKDVTEIEISKEQPVKSALDNIQQTLEDTHKTTNTIGTVALGALVSAAKCTIGDIHPSARITPPLHTSSPSPSLLNPLATEWKEQPDIRVVTKPKLVCPVLDIASSSSSSLEALMLRLEEGFRVRLIGGPISCSATEDTVCLYLHEDRSRLCVKSVDLPEEYRGGDEKKDENLFWIDILVADIFRLEIGGSNKNSKSFSLVLEGEGVCLVYYDFETASAIDREVVVTTLMLLLDKTHNSQSENDDTFDWSGGTLDQPIPCSPSLDHPLDFRSSLEQPIVCSPSLELECLRGSRQLSPRRRTHIFNSADNAETETSLVIHLDDVSLPESTFSRAVRDWSRRELCPPSLQQNCASSDEPEEARLDFKPSASSTQLGICPNNSALVAPTAWCYADSCSLALNDIADTCTGIFALKHNDSVCTPAMGREQRIVVEEFIANALGAPTAMFTYLTEGDVWNVETSVTNQEPKDTTIARNRATLLNAQAARLRELRNEMTFAAALKQSKGRMQFVQTVQSFDDAYTRAGGTKKLRVATEAANLFHSSPLLNSIVGSMRLHDPDGQSKKDDDDVVFYDSDPEDSRPHHRTADRGPRQVAADRLNKAPDTNCRVHHRALSGVGFEEIGTTRKVSRKLDEEAIVEIVQVSRKFVVSQSKNFSNRFPYLSCSLSPWRQ